MIQINSHMWLLLTQMSQDVWQFIINRSIYHRCFYAHSHAHVAFRGLCSLPFRSKGKDNHTHKTMKTTCMFCIIWRNHLAFSCCLRRRVSLVVVPSGGKSRLPAQSSPRSPNNLPTGSTITVVLVRTFTQATQTFTTNHGIIPWRFHADAPRVHRVSAAKTNKQYEAVTAIHVNMLSLSVAILLKQAASRSYSCVRRDVVSCQGPDFWSWIRIERGPLKHLAISAKPKVLFFLPI